MPRSIVVLTGAGISVESGLPVYRGADGLWENRRLEELATPEAFEADPELVLRFYNERRRQLLDDRVRPNRAHRALARLEREYDGSVFLVTQNVDDLHERAGTTRVLHMHGELLWMLCVHCGAQFECRTDIHRDDVCRACGHQSTLRPDVVWFGEMPRQMPEIQAALNQCDLFMSVGTSGNVYPAAGFVELANNGGARSIEVNPESTSVASLFHEHRKARACEEIPSLVADLLLEP